MLLDVGDLNAPQYIYKRKVVEFMKKVPVELIPVLLAEEEKFRDENCVDGFLLSKTAFERPAYMDCSYKKNHDVPEGIYTVKLLDIKCHTTTAYRMKLELLNYKEEGKVIYGYGERYGSDFSDLADCFGEEFVLHRKSTGYIGKVGRVSLSHSGWIKMLSRFIFTETEQGVLK